MKGSVAMVAGLGEGVVVSEEVDLERREEMEVGRTAERPGADFDEEEEEDSAPTRFPKTRRRLTPPSG